MPDYSLSKIYKLVSNKTTDIYIGSCLMRLSTRLSTHKNKSNTTVSKKLFVDDAIITIVLIENYPCNSKNELKARELYHITSNTCININKPFVCDIPYGKAWSKEYQKANKEQISAKAKEYYLANTEQINAYNKEYYQANKEQINAYNKEYHQANKEQIKAYKKEYNKEYYQNNRDQTNIQQRARYAEKKLSQKLESTLNKNIIV